MAALAAGRERWVGWAYIGVQLAFMCARVLWPQRKVTRAALWLVSYAKVFSLNFALRRVP